MAPKQSNRENKRTPAAQVGEVTSTHQPRTLLDLSTELLIEILTHLPVADLLSMQHTCSTMRNIIDGTVYLQYIIRTHINGVDDSLPPEFSYSERLELLRRHEQSWNTLQVNLLTECTTNFTSTYGDFILQDGYLIYENIMGNEQRYRYTDLSSAALNEDLRWVHVTMNDGRLPPGGLSAIKYAVDHDLVVTISQEQGQDHEILVHFGFFEFTTGTPHHLSPTHIVSLLPFEGDYPYNISVEVIGDHILVLSDWTSCEPFFHLVSWKTGTVTPICGLLQIDIGLAWRYWKLELIVINNSLIALFDPQTNSLDIYKLDIVHPNPQLKKLCSLDLPQLTRNGRVHPSGGWEWIPTSKCRGWSGSSRRRHTTFYSSTVGTIRLHLPYYLSDWWDRSDYAMIIDVAKLLSAIPPDVRSIPWVDWGPSSTHIFETHRTTMPIPAGPFWITHPSPLVVRDYSVLRIRYTQSTAGDALSSYSHQLVNTPTETYNEYLEKYKIKTHLPYRDIVANHLDFDRFKSVIADREWIVGITNTVLGGRRSVAVYHVG